MNPIHDVEDTAFGGWTPPTYRVDVAGKVVGAKPGSVNNWGRWGENDQRGTANLLTCERVAAAAALVCSGESYSLGLPMGRGAANVGTRAPVQHLFGRSTGDHVLGDLGPGGLQSADDVVVMALQAATQLDGLAHVGEADVLYNGFWAGLVTSHSGARRLGIHNLAEGVVGRGVLLDVAGVHGIDPFEQAIDTALLETTAASHGVRIGAGDIVLVRTGYLGAWLSDAKLQKRRRQSGLAASTIEWFADNDVAMVAADNRTVEVIPDPDGGMLPFHVAAIRDLGLLLGELFCLDELAMGCHADSRFEFLFVAMPLPIVNAVGSPLNPVAVK